MLPKVITTTVKAALIVAGAGFGLLRGLRLLEGLADNSGALEAIEERLDGMQVQIAALHARDEHLQAQLKRSTTKDEVEAALDEGFKRIQSENKSRFEEQARSVEALRAMVGQTDELLERLLDRLESVRSEAELQSVTD